jgi:hypothetical protein
MPVEQFSVQLCLDQQTLTNIIETDLFSLVHARIFVIVAGAPPSNSTQTLEAAIA